MEEIKRRFANEIAARLAGAAESDAKQEMIEELAENLAGRYGDMTAAGTPEDEAFARAMEELGDVDELTAYLNSLEPEGPGAEGGAAAPDMDAFFRTIGDMGRAIGDMAREAAGVAGDFFRSDSFKDSVRTATEEGKRAAREARDYLKGVTSVHIHVDDDGAASGGERDVPSQGVTSLDIETAGGDVTILAGQTADGPILVDGNVARLEIFVSEAGVFTVREKPTASNQFFSFRGMTSADVELRVPARVWERVRIVTASGDVELGKGLQIRALEVRTASGDLYRPDGTGESLEFHSASGDLTVRGHVEDLRAKTASGDVELEGSVGSAAVSTSSGDISLKGTVGQVRAGTMSGDIEIVSRALPMGMDLNAKSGDVLARIPASGPFAVSMDSVSGETEYLFPRQWDTQAAEGPVPQYRLSSISGDVTLEEYTER